MSEPTSQPWPDRDMIEAAMGIISNVGGGNWWGQSQEWQDAARKWLDAYARLGKPQLPELDSNQQPSG